MEALSSEVCPNCSKVLSLSATVFCEWCGYSLKSPDQIPVMEEWTMPITTPIQSVDEQINERPVDANLFKANFNP